MSSPARLLQLHGVIVDLIYRVEAVPQPGCETIVRGFDMSPGGGFNAMIAARRSGLAVGYAGSLGTGPLSEIVHAALAAEGIECLRPRDRERDQGCCTVMIDDAGERTFVAAEGAEGHAVEADLQHVDTTEFGWSLISGYTLYYEGSCGAFSRWLEAEPNIRNLVFDPGPMIASIRPEAIETALARAAWVSANAAEAAVLTGDHDPLTAARKLAETRKGGAVVRLGREGCVAAWNGHHRYVPAHLVTAVDTNGAGDAHIGAFIAALARGQDPAEAALYANIAAAISTTRRGPATAPDLATIEETLRLKEAG